MGKEIRTPSTQNIAGEYEIIILIETQLIRFAGSWQVEAMGERRENDLLTGLNYNYLIRIRNENHLVHPDDIPIITDALKSVSDSGDFEVALRVVHPDNHLLRLHARGHLLNGEKHEVESELERRLRQYTEMSSGSCSWIWDLPGDTISFSENSAAVLGLDPATQLKNWDDLLTFVHKNDRQKVGELSAVAQQAKRRTSTDFRIVRADDQSLRHIHARAEIVEITGGGKFCIGAMQDVTAEKLAQQNLEESKAAAARQKLEAETKIKSRETLFNEAEIVGGLGSYEAELPSMKFTFSDNMYRLLGYKPYAFRPTLDFIDSISVSGDAKEVRAILEDAIRQRKPYTYTRRIILPNGELRFISSKGKVILDDAGVPVRILGIAQDVTQQKLSEAALNEGHKEKNEFQQELKNSQDTIAQMLDASMAAVAMLSAVRDADGSIVDFVFRRLNTAATTFTGMSSAELVGKKLFDVFPDSRKLFYESYCAVIESGISHRDNYTYQYDGTDHWLDVSAVKNGDGLIITFLDITAQKNAERDLISERRLLRQFFEASPCSVCLVRPVRDSVKILDFEILEYNNGALRIAGLTAEEFSGKHYSVVFPMGWPTPVLDVLTQLAESGEPTDVEYFQPSKGSGRWLYTSAVKDGELILITTEDITRKKAAAQTGSLLNETESGCKIQSEYPWKVSGHVFTATEAARELKKNYEILQQSEEVASMGSWEFDLAQEKFSWSDGMYRLFGLPRGTEVQPEIYREYAVVEDLPVVERILLHLRSDPQPLEEIIRIRVGGEVKTLRIKGTVLRNENDAPVRVLGVDLDISAIVRSETELRDQSHFISSVVETIPDMLSVIELSTRRIKYYNKAAFSMHGYDADLLSRAKQKQMRELIHPEDRDLVTQYFAAFNTLPDEGVNSVEYRAKNTAGIWQWFRAKGKVFRRDKNGQATECVNVVQNIDFQKNAEERIRDQGHYIQRLVETVPDPILIYDLTLEQLIYCNPGVYQLLGYTPDELQVMKGEAFNKCIHPADRPAQKDLPHFVRSLSENVTYQVFRMIHRDGTQKTVQVRHTPFRRNKNGKVSQVVAIFRDITELKKTEAENLRMKELLAEQAENRYRQLFNSIDEGFAIVEVIFDETGKAVDYRFLESNPAFEKLTDLRNSTGKTINEMLPGIEHYWFEIYGEIAKTRESRRFIQRAALHRNRWYEVFAFPVGDSGSNKLGIIFSDITERRQTEEQLLELNKRLQESDKVKTDFFNNVSHELRTPLTLMLGPLEDMLQKPELFVDRGHVQKLQLAFRNALRLQKLVNNLLDFSRLEAGRMEAAFQPTDIARFTADLAGNFRSTLEKAGLELVIEPAVIGEPVYVDRSMWEKIIFNLLSNAYKFTAEGTIRISMQQKDTRVEITISDTGVGIDQKNISVLFDRFRRFRPNPGRSYSGTGIGLALTRELVLLHGGEISVTSTPGKGSAFTITLVTGKDHLPAESVLESDSSIASFTANRELGSIEWLPIESVTPGGEARPEKVRHRADGKMPLVFLVDDHEDMRVYLHSLLAENYNIISLDNGKKALDLLKRGVLPDLILSDVMMPEVDGFELLRTIKTSPQWKLIPLILISARAGEESRIEGMEYGADDYLIKPFSGRELLARVNARIEIAALRNQREKILQEVNRQLEHQVHERTKELLVSRDDLRAQKELLQRCLDAMPQLVWTTDPLGRFIMFNERWYEYTGLPYEAEGLNYIRSGVIHPSQLREVESKWQFSINEGIAYSNETLIRDRNGIYHWHLDQVTPIKNEEGEIYMWVGTLTNVHEQFLAEKKVEDNRNLLRTILNSSPIAIAQLECCRDEKDHSIIDFEWKYYNGITELIFGPDLQDRKLSEVTPGTMKDGFFKKLKKTVVKGEPYQFQYKVTQDSGEVIYQTAMAKLEDSIVVTLQDITAHIRGAEQMQQLNASLEQKNSDLQDMNEQLSTFAFVASHDLREPLRKIQFFINGIIQSDKNVLSEKGQLYFNKVLASTNRMEALINDILKFSRANSGEGMVEVDLNKVFLLAVNDLSEIIREKKAVVRNSVLPVVKGNQVQLIQLFQNLVSNGLKFQEAGKTPVIDVTAEIVSGNTVVHSHADKRKDYVCIEFKDNGIGFEEEYLPKIFQMFQRLHGMTEYPGTGMGLAICKKIAENHNGFITARSKPGQGAAFNCYIPVHVPRP